MKHKKFLKRKFSGSPPLFASINIEGVKPYIKEYGSNKLNHCPTNKEIQQNIHTLKEEFIYRKNSRKLALERLQKSQETVIVMKDLVLFSPEEGAFYLFSHFTNKFAIFKFLKPL